jgi:hypothetical protein
MSWLLQLLFAIMSLLLRGTGIFQQLKGLNWFCINIGFLQIFRAIPE